VGGWVELVGGGGPVGRGGEIPKNTFSSANRRLQKLNLPLWPKRTIYRFGCAKMVRCVLFFKIFFLSNMEFDVDLTKRCISLNITTVNKI
jgi:hypothetical protein